jgi:hypothetical protein
MMNMLTAAECLSMCNELEICRSIGTLMERIPVLIVRKLSKKMVDLSGIEPLASSLRTRRSPS